MVDLSLLRDSPTDDVLEYLMAFDGVGRKTAVCAALFELGRDIMRKLVPKGRAYLLHVNLVRLGREICRPQRPRCTDCPLKAHCISAS
ncbi:hypothetical protein K8S17_04580 [bacterium]|nr:hypothetical protein [bacterium]